MASLNARQILNSSYNQALLPYLRKLDVDTRNKVRAISTLQDEKAIKILNNLRRDLSVGKLLIVEKAISALHDSESILPEKFPKTPQTHEGYNRLTPLPIIKHLSLINSILKEHGKRLLSFAQELRVLNSSIIREDYVNAAAKVEEIIKNFGYSHCILRKAVLVKELCKEQSQNSFLHKFLDDAAETSKLITSSLIHCFQDEQDYLGIKRSIMALPDKGYSNKFTRDIARLPFHAHAKNVNDLEELLQSCLQSSLIDTLIMLKVNENNIELKEFSEIVNILAHFEQAAPSVEDVIGLYGIDGTSEFLFFKQSSAWLE